MKQRVISGALIGAALVAVIALGSKFSITYSVATAILGAVCVFELFNNTGFIKSMPLLVAGSIFAVISPFVHKYALDFDYSYVLFIYVVAVVIISLIDFKDLPQNHVLCNCQANGGCVCIKKHCFNGG